MSVRPSMRVAVILAGAVLLTVTGCGGGGPTPDSTGVVSGNPPAGASALQYKMNVGDSIGPICIHLIMPYSDRICPDSTSFQYFRLSDVRSMRLTVNLRNGTTRTIQIDTVPDAIFLSNSAISTFLIRHYDAVDPAKAADLRAFLSSAAYRP